MAVVDTKMGMRYQRESARRIRFEPVGTITATNTQNAIEQVGGLTPTILEAGQTANEEHHEPS